MMMKPKTIRIIAIVTMVAMAITTVVSTVFFL